MFIKKEMILKGLSVIVSLLLVIYLTLLFFNQSLNDSASGAIVVNVFALFIFKYSGYALTSTMFYELNSSGSAPFIYTLPAKTSEKLFSAWLFSFVGYTTVGLTALYLFSLIIGMDANWIFSKENFVQIQIYTIGQSVYFLGAVYFRNNNFLSTFLALLIVGIGFSLVIFFIKEHFPGFEAWTSYIWIQLEHYLFSSNLKSILFTAVISSGFIGLAYRKLKNRQIA
jgi:hypothetical protein